MTAETRSPRPPLPRAARLALAPLRLVERSRGWRRLALLGVYAMTLAVVGSVVHRQTCLIGLPDVEPFDRAAYERISIPEDRDALVLYRRAAVEVTSEALKGRESEMRRIAISVPWSRASPAFRAWIHENRDGALATWRRGTERPDALLWPSADRAGTWHYLDRSRWFWRMALPEGSRLEQAGDMAGAWGWYLAAYRSARHHGMRAAAYDWRRASGVTSVLSGIGLRWAEDPRTDPDLIRRALADLRRADAELATVSDAHTIRAEYMESALEQLRYELEDQARRGFVDERAEWYLRLAIPGVAEVCQLPLWARYAIGREAERSRRVLKLAFANWIAAAEAGQLDGAPAAQSRTGRKDVPAIPFFDVGPDAPPEARAISPRELARWCDSTMLARSILAECWDNLVGFRRHARASRGRLASILAQSLDRREHGEPPDPPEALAGPDLDRLPEGDDPDGGGLR